MNLAVKLYGAIDVGSKPSGIPDEWPAEVLELGDSTDLPDDTWLLMTVDDYAAYRSSYISAYIAWASSYYAVTPVQVVSQKIKSAKAFGEDLVVQFASENVVMGITAAGKTGLVADYLQKLHYYVSSGSLYQAINEINSLLDAGIDSSLNPYVTVDRLNLYKSKISNFLGS